MKEKIFNYSKNRSFITNFIICLISLCSILLVPLIIQLLFSSFIKDGYVLTLLSNVILIIFLCLLYMKDLRLEAKTYFKNFWNNYKIGLKYYGLGVLAMVIFNAIIVVLLKDVSANENEVRQMLYTSPIISLLSISIFAPFSEELIFRKSIRPLINNKLLYALICGFLFGFAHILINFTSGSFVIPDLLYILPYGSLGFAFAYMDYETNTTFTSIFMHATHNTVAALLLLLLYSGGIK